MQEEKYNTRDRSYSAWHRRLSTRRFVGIENAQLLAMIDLDASLYVEYDDGTKEPLALVETAIDIGQRVKVATVTEKLAKRSRLPAYVLLYKLSTEKNPEDQRHFDIVSFRVRRIYPRPEMDWKTYSPAEWAHNLLRLRKWSASRLDSILDTERSPRIGSCSEAVS